MKTFIATKRDNEKNIMRLELSGDDIDTLEAVVERLEALEKIEAALDVVAARGPFIQSKDIPTVTKEGRELIMAIVHGWYGGDPDDGEGYVLIEVVDD